MTWETWLLISLLTLGVIVIIGALIEDWRGTRRLDTECASCSHEMLRLRTLDGGYLDVPFMTGRVTSHRGW